MEPVNCNFKTGEKKLEWILTKRKKEKKEKMQKERKNKKERIVEKEKRDWNDLKIHWLVKVCRGESQKERKFFPSHFLSLLLSLLLTHSLSSFLSLPVKELSKLDFFTPESGFKIFSCRDCFIIFKRIKNRKIRESVIIVKR